MCPDLLSKTAPPPRPCEVGMKDTPGFRLSCTGRRSSHIHNIYIYIYVYTHTTYIYMYTYIRYLSLHLSLSILYIYIYIYLSISMCCIHITQHMYVWRSTREKAREARRKGRKRRPASRQGQKLAAYLIPLLGGAHAERARPAETARLAQSPASGRLSTEVTFGRG